MRTLLRGAVAAIALSLAPVAVVATSVAPAHAAVTVSTTTAFLPDIVKHGVYGSDFYVRGTVDAPDAPDGYPPSVGEAVLQRQAPGSKSWTKVATDDTPSYVLLDPKFKGNAQYRLYYTGGTSGDTTYSPSVSKAITVKVSRKVNFSSVSGKSQPTADVKVSPKFGKKKIVIQKKQGKGYKTYRKFKTNKKGKVRFSVPGSSKGIKYRLVAPANKQFVATKLKFTATRY